MKKSIIFFLICIISICIYNSYVGSQIETIMEDFKNVIHGKKIDNNINETHLKSYYPNRDYICTGIDCEHAYIFGNKGKMYLQMHQILLYYEENEYYSDWSHEFTMDIEKIDGIWYINKIKFDP